MCEFSQIHVFPLTHLSAVPSLIDSTGMDKSSNSKATVCGDPKWTVMIRWPSSVETLRRRRYSVVVVSGRRRTAAEVNDLRAPQSAQDNVWPMRNITAGLNGYRRAFGRCCRWKNHCEKTRETNLWETNALLDEMEGVGQLCTGHWSSVQLFRAEWSLEVEWIW